MSVPVRAKGTPSIVKENTLHFFLLLFTKKIVNRFKLKFQQTFWGKKLGRLNILYLFCYCKIIYLCC